MYPLLRSCSILNNFFDVILLVQESFHFVNGLVSRPAFTWLIVACSNATKCMLKQYCYKVEFSQLLTYLQYSSTGMLRLFILGFEGCGSLQEWECQRFCFVYS